jgi:hypothetical protein
MQINLRVKYADETSKDLTAVAVDLVAFETKFDLSIARLEQNIKLTHLFFLAYNIEKRTGATADEFEKWLESVESIEATSPKK